MNSLKSFAVQASTTANIKLNHRRENAESWKASPESDSRRCSELPEHAQRQSKGKVAAENLTSAAMAVQPVRSVESPKRSDSSQSKDSINMEYLDDGNAAPRYSEKPLTDGEGWDAEPEGVRRCREMEGNGLPCLSNPHSPNQYHHTRTRNPHSVVGRRRIVTPKYMLELFTSIGINSLCLKDLHLPWTAGLQPPVTAMSLTELDLQRIMNNTKLRADINYDADLHFKPNLEGENGRKKCDEAKEYWKALAVELLLYRALCSEGDFGQLPSFAPITVDDQERIFTSRLPPMFETIRAILQSLVPEQERSFMDERFDGPLLMQQIQRGCLDFKNLSTWLAQVLKRHCAPMRDSMVDGMLERISRGADNVEVLVDGLKDLFGILEVMKLDVANHQIRSLRPLLIQDTIIFQQNYIIRKIASGHISIGPMQNWYARASENQRIDRDRDGRGQMVMFFQAMVQLLSSFNRPESFPPTFNFDITRLWRLRSDVRDTVNLGVCTVLFAVLLDRAGHSEPPTSDMLGSLRFSCLSILEDFDGEARWGQHIEHIALEITRSAHRVCGSTHLSSDLEFAEDFISEAVGSGLGCWSQMQKNVEVELWSSLQAHVNVYEKMSPLDMLSHAETYTNVASRPLSFEFDCIARRIAHIGMLHWRVWAPLIYLRQNPTSSTSDPMT